MTAFEEITDLPNALKYALYIIIKDVKRGVLEVNLHNSQQIRILYANNYSCRYNYNNECYINGYILRILSDYCGYFDVDCRLDSNKSINEEQLNLIFSSIKNQIINKINKERNINIYEIKNIIINEKTRNNTRRKMKQLNEEFKVYIEKKIDEKYQKNMKQVLDELYYLPPNPKINFPGGQGYIKSLENYDDLLNN